MSYKSPSRIINRQAQEIQAGGQRIQNQILETTDEYQKSVELQKKQLENLEKENVQLESNFIDRVNSATKGHGEIDKEVVGIFDTIIDQSRENKRLADLGEANGGISKREYMLRQKSLETAPQDFKVQADYMAAQVQDFQEALNNGEMSSVGSVENKAVLNAMSQNQPVKIHREGSEFFYYIPKEDEDGNFLPWPENEGKLNGTAMMDNAAQEKDLFSRKADINGVVDLAWEKNNEAELGDIGQFITETTIKNGDIHPITGEVVEMEDGYEQVITMPKSDNRNKFIDKVEAGSMFTPLLGNQKKMLSVWQDTIPDGEKQEDGSYTPNSLASFAEEGNELGISLSDMGITMKQWQDSVYGEYPTNLSPEQKSLIQQNQAKAAKRYMANLAWDKNSISAGGHKTGGKRKIVEKPKPGNTGTPKEKTLYEGLNSTQRLSYAGNKRKEQRLVKELEAVKYGPNGEVDTDTITAYENKGYDFGENPPATKEEFEKIIYEQDGLDDTYFAIKDSETGDEVKVVANSTSTGDSIFGKPPTPTN